jgi:hypothetical protein
MSKNIEVYLAVSLLIIYDKSLFIILASRKNYSQIEDLSRFGRGKSEKNIFTVSPHPGFMELLADAEPGFCLRHDARFAGTGE